ncbi:Hypothetical predicted protein [Paramuricea clavata]|uniref:Uncharacterized protein n=1 Tax=Paramuricea clavata TaxID=317549 RepID=A0A6S7H507_PARCT|nr:Hypothetical predicted protein [Paramuricea clavata]
MLESLNQFTKFLFILILVARISVSQPKESRNAAKCATKCVNDMEKLAQLKQTCKTMTLSKCGPHFGARTEKIPKSRRKCFRVNINRSSTKSAECVQLLNNTTSQTQIKSCYTFVYFCFYSDVVKFLEQEMRNAGAHSVQTNDVAMKQDSLVNLKKTPESKTMPRLIRSLSNSTSSSTTQAPTPTKFFDDWAHGLLVAAGALIVLLVSIFTIVFFKYRKRRTSGRNVSCTVELQPVSPTPTLGQNSPICCEADTFQSPRKDWEHHSETSEIVETEVDRSTADVEGNSDDEYCYPDSIEDKYENMIPVDPLEASGEYARAYDHTNINTGYMKEDGYEVPRDYDYPQNTRDWQDSGFKDATLSSSEPVTPLNKDNVDCTGYRNEDDYEVPRDYDWRDSGFKEATLSLSSSEPVNPLKKDKVDDNFYENNQILLRESLENENETDI